MTDKPEEGTVPAIEVEKQDNIRKDPKWGVMTKEGLIIGRGTTKTIIDPKEVEQLAELHCSLKEMSDFFNVPRETLKYNFRDLITKGKERTKQRLRRAQIKLALSGNATMLIWLGKNMLGQEENPLDSSVNMPLPWSDD
jgi:hypothetical protein